MKFSVRVQYGLQALFELAAQYGSGPIQIGDIAKSQRIPVRYLEQLLLVLKRRELVASIRGKQGGYTLAKHPSDLSVLEVIEVFEGPIEFCSKKMKGKTVLCEAFQRIEEKFKNDLAAVTVEDLVFRKRQKERAYIYNI